MIEKNRDILKNAINNLPERKAGQEIWSGIAGTLDHLKLNLFIKNNVSRLPEHKAPAGVWSGIAKGLKVSSMAGLSAMLLKIAPVFLIGAALITSIFIFLPRENEMINPKMNNASNSYGISDEKENTDKLQENNLFDLEGPQATIRNKNETIQLKESVLKNRFDPDHKTNPESSSLTRVNLNSKDQVVDKDQFDNKFKASALRFKRFSGLSTGDGYHSAVQKRGGDYFSGQQDDYYSKKRPPDISLGGFYSGLLFSKVEIGNMDLPDFVSSAGLDVMIEGSRLYIKSGISYLSWEEKGRYTYNYNRNEMIYSYHYVDSARFIPETNKVEYYTTKQDVYDSISYQQRDAIRKQYKILQIPLIVGYKVYEDRRLMLGLNAGIGADIRIGGSEYIPEFNEDQSAITGVENHMLYRTNMNWRLLGGVMLFYRLSNSISIYCEPSYQIYLNDVYRNARPGRISYFEIKAGIRLKF